MERGQRWTRVQIHEAEIDLILKAMTAIATTVVAVYVARISKRQWLTNREKLRLDLYDRRFKIYVHVIEFHRAVVAWDGSKEQRDLEGPFTQALRESRFLFPESSGVFAFLKEFSGNAFFIVNFDKLEPMKTVNIEEYAKQALRKTDCVNWILSSVEPLEKKLAPFLNFHDM
jgi:hypothetical protein